MEFIIIGLLVIVIIILVIMLIKNKKEEINDANITERLGRFEVSVMKELANFKDGLSKNMNDDFNKLNTNVENRLMMINEKVNERLDYNFEKTNKTFTNVIERLSKIDEAQKKIDNLSSDIISLESILTDKKSRGIIADSVLFAPEPLGVIAIDSKFPLENYQKMVDHNTSKEERNMYEKMFKADVKKHIDAISSKYIIPGETSDQAILFLPAEAIFAEINAYHQDVIDYAYKKRVWITSPTTLISTLTVVEMIIKNIERDKYTKVIHEELNKLGVEFSRYKDRWDKLSRSIQTVNKDVESFSITTEKLSKKFQAINRVEIKELDNSLNIDEN